MDLTNFREGLDLVEKGMRKFQHGPFDYYLRKLTECHDLLIEKYAPFRVGDRVFLKETPRITVEESPGWVRSAHFLVRGAAGTVRAVDVDGRGFYASVEFDDESWISEHGPDKGALHVVKPEKRHTFNFHENMLARLPSTVSPSLPEAKL